MSKASKALALALQRMLVNQMAIMEALTVPHRQRNCEGLARAHESTGELVMMSEFWEVLGRGENDKQNAEKC